MPNDIRISVELKESGKTSVGSYLSDLKKANTATEDLKKAYANLGKVASESVVRMSQVTDKLIVGIRESIDLMKKQAGFDLYVKLRGDVAKASTEVRTLNNELRSFAGESIKVRNVSNDFLMLGNSIRKVSIESHGSYDSFNKLVPEIRKAKTEISSYAALSSGIRKVSNDVKSNYLAFTGLVPVVKKTKTTVVSAYAAMSGSTRSFSGATRTASSTVKKLGGDLFTLSGGLSKIAVDTKRSAEELKRTTSIMGLFSNKTQTMIQGVKRLGSAIKTYLGVRMMALGSQMRDASSSALELASDFQGYRNALAVAADATLDIEDRLASANHELNMAIGIAQKYKLSIVAVTKSYSKFVNALSLANVPLEEAREHYENFAKFARVANLSAMNTSGMFLALEQMVSKGVVSMEELRRQLGEHLPGAVNIAAQAMGMGTREFIKKVSKGQQDSIELITKLGRALSERVTPLVESSLQKYSANIEDVRNEWIRLKVTLGNFATNFINPILESFANTLRWLNKFTHSVGETKKAIKEFEKGGTTAADALDELRDATANFTGTSEEVVAEAKKMNQEFSKMTLFSGDISNNLAIMALGFISAKAAVLFFLSPVKLLFNLFLKAKGYISPAVGQLNLFAKATIWSRIAGWSKNIWTFASSIKGLYGGLFALGAYAIESSYKIGKVITVTSEAKFENYKFSDSLDVVGRAIFNANKKLPGYKKNLKEIQQKMEGVEQTQAFLNLELAKSAKVYSDTSNELDRSKVIFADYLKMIKKMKDSGASAEMITVLSSAIPGFVTKLTSLTNELGTAVNNFSNLSNVSFEAAKYIRDVGSATVMTKEQVAEYGEEMANLARQYNILIDPSKKNEFEVLKFSVKKGDKEYESMLEMLKKIDARKEYNKQLKDTKRSIEDLTKSTKDYVVEEKKNQDTINMTKEEIDLYDAAIEFNNKLLEIQKMRLKSLTSEQLIQINTMDASIKAAYEDKKSRLESIKTIEDQKRAVEDLKEQMEGEIDLLSAQLNMMDALTEARLSANNSSNHEFMKAEEMSIVRNIIVLKEQIKLIKATEEASDSSRAKILDIEAEIIRLGIDLNEINSEFTEIFENSFATMFEDILTGTKSWGDAMKDMVFNIANEINKILSQNIARSFMAALGGSFGSFGFGGAPVVDMGVPLIQSAPTILAAADGAHASANEPFIVGEEGQELFVPDKAGTIVPNGKFGGSTIVNIEQHFIIDASGDEDLEFRLREAVERGGEEGYNKVLGDLQSRGPIRRSI